MSMAEEVTYTSLAFPQMRDAPQAAGKQHPAINKLYPSWLFAAVAMGVGILVNVILTVSIGTFILFNLERFSTKESIQNLKDQLEESQDILQRADSFLREWETLLSGQPRVCTTGWLQNDGKCYYFSSTRTTWEDSKKFCKLQDSELLMIKDNKTLSFIQEHSNGTGYFIGLEKEYGNWKWLDGTFLDKLFNVQKSENYFQCVRVSYGEFWQEACYRNFQWICEKEAYMFQLFQSSPLPPRSLFGHENPTGRRPT